MNKDSVLTFAVIGILIFGYISPAFAAQLYWDAKDFESAQNPKFTFMRTAIIEFKDGGQIADALRGKDTSISFTADSTTPGVQQLIDKLNENLASKGSSAHVRDVKIEYSASMTVREDNAGISYRIILIPTIEGFLIREYQEGSPALFDATWRGIKVDGQFPIMTEQYGSVEINQPLSFLRLAAPEAAAAIQGTAAQPILEASLIDSSGIGNLPIKNWHFLFDPTGIAVDAARYGFTGAKVVVSSFTMGESSFREGQIREKVLKATFTADKKYHVETVEAGDSANMFLTGYASPDILAGHEVIGVSPTAPAGAATTATGSFPVFIIYGMTGIAAAGAAGFFIWSSKKAKRESEYVQRGIDPKYLRAMSTSEAAGGYHTTRGEAELIGEDQSYKQHQSVYERGSLPAGYEKKEEEKPSSPRGSMPKDWKPS